MSDERVPGWYPDPFGTGPGDRRYWDGETWLAATPPPTPTAQLESEVESPNLQSQSWQVSADDGASYGVGDQPRDRVVTPDGVRLATWGRRFAAYVLDAILLGIASAVIALPIGLYDALGELADRLESASTEAQLAQTQAEFVAGNAALLGGLSLLSIAMSALYTIGMTATRGATLGKMALGISVRLRAKEGLPGWRAAALRWLVQFGPGLLASLPVISFMATVFQVVDGLWPIWDSKRQAIHDIVAKTNVVVRSR